MKRKILTGVGWGMVATMAMSTAHRIAHALGLFPLWKSVPMSVTEKLFGSGIHEPWILILTWAVHLSYGGFWGGVLFARERCVTVRKGIALGLFLWLVMQFVVFPFLGRGIFSYRVATNVFAIPAAALVEHLVYGTTIGLLGRWSTPATMRSSLLPDQDTA